MADLLMVGGDVDDEEDDDGGGSSELDAAKDILAAIARKDATALSLALKRHNEACKASDDDEPEDDDAEEY